MSPRARPPTDDVSTEVFDPGALRAPLAVAPPDRELPRGSSDSFQSFEQDATEQNPRQGVSPVEQPTPTAIDPSPPLPPAAPELAASPERSEPIRVISMKDHMAAQPPPAEGERVPLHVQLRSLAQASGRHDVQPGLGHLAPPFDPHGRHGAQAPRTRVTARWLVVAIALAAAIALAIGLLARR